MIIKVRVLLYRVLCYGPTHWNSSHKLREQGICKVELAWSSCKKKLNQCVQPRIMFGDGSSKIREHGVPACKIN